MNAIDIKPLRAGEASLGTEKKAWDQVAVGQLHTIKRKTRYRTDDMVYAYGIPSWGHLRCVSTGKTAEVCPDFSEMKKVGDIITDGTVVWQLQNEDSLTFVIRSMVGNEKFLAYSAEYYRTGFWKVIDTRIWTPATHSVALHGFMLVNDHSIMLQLNNKAYWDDKTYVDPEARAGKDFYIYAIKGERDDNNLQYILSARKDYPVDMTPMTSRMIGGFHCLCEDVGDIMYTAQGVFTMDAEQAVEYIKHPLSGLKKGDILPDSIWDLKHRPISEPEGMVYCAEGDFWVDIYLNSLEIDEEDINNSRFGSKFRGVIQNTIEDKAVDKKRFFPIAAIYMQYYHGKRFPTYLEFTMLAAGSPQQVRCRDDVPLYAGGRYAVNNQRIISDIGCEDCTGVYAQFLDSVFGVSTSAATLDRNTTIIDLPDFNPGNYGILQHMTGGGQYDHDEAKIGSRCLPFLVYDNVTNGALAFRGVSQPQYNNRGE